MRELVREGIHRERQRPWTIRDRGLSPRQGNRCMPSWESTRMPQQRTSRSVTGIHVAPHTKRRENRSVFLYEPLEGVRGLLPVPLSVIMYPEINRGY